MTAEALKKIPFKKILWIFLGTVFAILGVYYFNKFSCYFLDKKAFLSPIAYSANIPIRDDAYGEGDFGAKRSGRRLHLGVDILAKIGEPVYAAKCGLVINAEHNRGMGNYVEILHRGGLVTIYGHLSRINVYQGQKVCQGDKVGEVGKTGNAKNRLILPHLHLEVRKFGIPQDPMWYLSSRQ
ncbi:MAG: M23 family metallopeptidase [Candidatus Omnitrophota bacterium]|nr:M23 family metallopeptidase [Candidatus Omnitrophota bacterium]